MSVPAWVVSEQWRALNPPAEVRMLGAQRSTSSLLAATRVLKVKEARRYQPVRTADGKLITWCNIYLADVLDILNAGIPHLWDGKELRANDIVTDLRAGAFPGWSRVWAQAATEMQVMNRAAAGLPTIAVWKNPAGPGHVMIVVPTPAGKSGVFVTGAGATCAEECPIAWSFGPHAPEVEFFGHD